MNQIAMAMLVFASVMAAAGITMKIRKYELYQLMFICAFLMTCFGVVIHIVEKHAYQVDRGETTIRFAKDETRGYHDINSVSLIGLMNKVNVFVELF